MDDNIVQRINFYVMRETWQIVKGRSRRGAVGYTIHDSLGMSRPRFERFIKGDGTRISQAELARWVYTTGISEEIFLGKKPLLNIKEATIERWQNVYNDNPKNFSKDVLEKIRKELKADIIKSIQQELSNKSNIAFQVLQQFIQDYIPQSKWGVDQLTKQLRSLEFSELDKIGGTKVLADFRSALIASREMVDTIIAYHHFKSSK